MAREIKVTVKGEITENLKRAFTERLAIALLQQYGEDGVDYILKELGKLRGEKGEQ